MCNKKIVIANIFVVIQLTLLGYFIAVSKWISPNIVIDIIVFAGIGLGLWAIFIADPRKVNVRPLPHPSGVLTTSGPYRLIRHPMYSAQLMVTLGWAINNKREMDYIIWGIYVVGLAAKLLFEESQLKIQFSDYSRYMKNTWRLIPLVW